MKNKKNCKKSFLNKKAKFKFHLFKEIIAGLSLKGWEVKSIRMGRINISNGYISIKNNEAFLINSDFQPLKTVFFYSSCNPYRERKLLLHKKEIKNLLKFTSILGYTIVPLKLFWKNSICKLLISIAKGKKLYDKRLHKKKESWKLEKFMLQKHSFLKKI
ncbi:SsrA-binding protein SmpB [Buchnera aphidicola]|uniref:SsrA-binding protein n=1 Tax=Buchnera aphidicola subsp. Tuberolachnus salignus TaxID=98804 RepID=A0A160SXE8_BUCTT|nr:SsrA-binding protein SmpB [Buchnera aphidicola]CUR53145.1 SsrA-binding protein [Buchnera aphidicola (Tuberolachnus salignus)]